MRGVRLKKPWLRDTRQTRRIELNVRQVTGKGSRAMLSRSQGLNKDLKRLQEDRILTAREKARAAGTARLKPTILVLRDTH